MAENELKVEKSVAVQQKNDRQNQNPILSILNNFHLNFPQFNKQQQKEREVPSAPKVVVESETRASNNKSDSARIPDARTEFPSLKLETEDSQEPGGGGGPSNMWQVYALGGFMIGRWLWARWNEKKAANSDKAQSGDDEQPSADN